MWNYCDLRLGIVMQRLLRDTNAVSQPLRLFWANSCSLCQKNLYQYFKFINNGKLHSKFLFVLSCHQWNRRPFLFGNTNSELQTQMPLNLQCDAFSKKPIVSAETHWIEFHSWSTIQLMWSLSFSRKNAWLPYLLKVEAQTEVEITPKSVSIYKCFHEPVDEYTHDEGEQLIPTLLNLFELSESIEFCFETKIFT